MLGRFQKAGIRRNRSGSASVSERRLRFEDLEKRLLLRAVGAVSPFNGQSDVDVGASIRAVFDFEADSSTINGSTFELRSPSGALVPATVTFDSANRTAILDPTDDLLDTSLYYTVTVIGGESGVKEAGTGLPLDDADVRWSFTTERPVFEDPVVLSGLNQPTVVRFAPSSDGRVFVAEKGGIIKVFDGLDDADGPDVFADFRARVHNYWDRGLLGMALDPNFPSSPYVYVHYTYNAPLDGGPFPAWSTIDGTNDTGPGTGGGGPPVSSRLSRLTIGPGNTWDGNELVLINDWPSQYPSHAVGTVEFGPDGALYVSAGDGASFGFPDYGQYDDLLGSDALNDPLNEGGALRSLDLLSSPEDPSIDPVTLDGTIIRVDPATGAALPTNPLYDAYGDNDDPNAERVVAFGLRNPFRFTVRDNGEIWIGDVGWNVWEEINVIRDPLAPQLNNFGWPAYEGVDRQGGYDNENLPLIESFYADVQADPSLHAEPFYAYNHSSRVDAGATEPTGSSAISGIAFHHGGNYPAAFEGALFFSDYNRGRVWAMFPGLDGEPDPSTVTTIIGPAQDPVGLYAGPDGNIYYVELNPSSANGGTVRRIEFFESNVPPNAVASADVLVGPAPLTVNFDGSGSTDPGDTLTYDWDLDGDGQFGDSSSAQPSFTYDVEGQYNVRLRVTDLGGLSDTASILIQVGSVPTVIIDTPLPTDLFQSNQVINFSGRAYEDDVIDEAQRLPDSALKWTFTFYQADENPSDFNIRNQQVYTGVGSGQYILPDWEYPVYLEVELTATDGSSLQSSQVFQVDPQVITLSVDTNPPGLAVDVNGSPKTAPVSQTIVVNSLNTISTPSPQVVGGTTYEFVSWSDGGAQSHSIIAGAQNESYTANFRPVGVSSVLYRVNAGGSLVSGSPDWESDSVTAQSPYVSGVGQVAVIGDAIDLSDTSVPAGTPEAIFQSERWAPDVAAEMQWDFPVTPGDYEVRLYFADTYIGTQGVGLRVFDVSVEGVVRLDNYDIYGTVGGYKGVMESLIVTSDGNLDIDFGHVIENPSIKGIEIIQLTSVNQPPLAFDDDLVSALTDTPVTFNVLDGSRTTGGTPDSDSDGSLVPATVRVTGGGVSNGTLVNRFDGTFVYTPDPGFRGVDSFTYTVDDNEGATSNEATVTITVRDSAGGTVLYRVNAGGSLVSGSPDWESDSVTAQSPYVSGVGQVAVIGDAIDLSDASVPAGTPEAIFQSERWAPDVAAEMQWDFPVTPGDYEVRLYFADTYIGTQGVGLRVFDVSVEGVVRLDNYDIYGTVGGYKGVMESLIVTSDANLDIDFGHVIENPSIKGIEIIQLTSVNQPPLAFDDDLVSALTDTPVTFNVLDGSRTTGGTPDSDSDGSLVPATVRVTGGGVSSGTLVNRFDGTFVYTPDPGFRGVDSFTYTVDDNEGATSNEAMVTITVRDSAGGTVLYRVNAGGSLVSGSPDWESDSVTAQSPYVSGVGQVAVIGDAIDLSDTSVPAGTPEAIFQSERWAPDVAAEMQWDFPVTPGDYEVRLYFADTYIGTQGVGLRVFDVSVEGVVRLDNYDIYGTVGGYKGVMESLIVTSDGNLDIDFGHVIENPSIKGIEIIQLTSVNQPPLAFDDDLVSALTDTPVTFNVLDGSRTTGGTPDSDSDGSLVPATVRVTGGGVSNGTLVNRFDGTFVYTPDPGFRGVDSFTYTVDDNEGATSNEATVTITVRDSAGGTVLYRVNAGGSLVSGSPDWESDSVTAQSPYVSGVGQVAVIGDAIDLSDASVPAGTPEAIFQSERWAPDVAAEMQWDFPVTPGDYEVRLYFADTYIGTQGVGLRVFDVSVEGVVRLDNYDIYGTVGGYKGVMESLIVTSDANLDIDFGHVIENPSIKGIEIIQLTSVGQSLDVNQDQTVSALDALVVINQLGRLSVAEGEFGSSRGINSQFDVNRDYRISANDALMIINYLSRDDAGGNHVTSMLPGTQNQQFVATSYFTDDSDRDESLDDVLLLLAEDVSKQLT